MSIPSLLRCSRSPSGGALAALAIAVVSGLLAAPAGARPMQLAFDPAVPTWGDAVRLVVTGRGCGPSLRAPVIASTGPYSGTIEVGLDDVCNIVSPPIWEPFRLEAELGRLEPGTYAVRVTDLEGFPEPVATRELHVYAVTIADLEIRGVATEREPPDVRVGAFHGCLGTDWRVEGQVITLEFDGGCPLLPRGPPSPTTGSRSPRSRPGSTTSGCSTSPGR